MSSLPLSPLQSLLEPSEKLSQSPSQNPLSQPEEVGSNPHRLFIRDDCGYAWTLIDLKPKPHWKIIAMKDLLEIDKVPEAGYFCSCWEEGIQILNKMGYITGNTEIIDPDEYDRFNET